MDKFSKEQTRDAVSAVRAELVALGYSIYEELKDGIYIESMNSFEFKLFTRSTSFASLSHILRTK